MESDSYVASESCSRAEQGSVDGKTSNTDDTTDTKRSEINNSTQIDIAGHARDSEMHHGASVDRASLLDNNWKFVLS